MTGTLVLFALFRAPAHAPAEPLPLTLTTIREMRAADYRSEDVKRESGYVPSTGMELEFGVRLPEGTRLASLSPPGELRAADGEGNDLTQIPPDVFGNREYLKTESGYGEELTLRVRLGAGARAATTFDLRLRTSALTYDGVDAVILAPAEDWAKFPHPSLERIDAEYRVVAEEGRATLVVRPGSAKEMIECVMPESADPDGAGYSVSWSEEAAEFAIDPAPAAGEKVRVKVRAGFREVPVVIDLVKQALP